MTTKDILIVEDGRGERERLQKLFASAGYSVVACEGVGEAEKTVIDYTFRLAILDIGLNDRSGSHLFHTLRQAKRANYAIIFTGNPSVHLKQRFLDEGAVDYIVKGSAQAQNEAFLNRVREVLGEPQKLGSAEGIELEEFLRRYVSEKSRRLFLDSDQTLPACRGCGSRRYFVTFSQQAQLPPDIVGSVVCADCSKPMDPEVK